MILSICASSYLLCIVRASQEIISTYF
uniref:Uncharacterized protein n=1 Tax=Anopheles dirus TaxID=7168 RepID=A0A182NWC1_9DIPT